MGFSSSEIFRVFVSPPCKFRKSLLVHLELVIHERRCGWTDVIVQHDISDQTVCAIVMFSIKLRSNLKVIEWLA
jgi:hypothetical protein